MEKKRKVFAYITKGSDEQQELLVFQYKGEPEEGLQVPGGTIEDNEMLIDALYRKVEEETGLTRKELQFLGKLHKYTYYPDHKDKAYERNIFHFEYTGEPRESWEHVAKVSGSNDNRTFQFHWEPVENLPKLAKDQDEAADML